jgi:hypothetical protein
MNLMKYDIVAVPLVTALAAGTYGTVHEISKSSAGHDGHLRGNQSQEVVSAKLADGVGTFALHGCGVKVKLTFGQELGALIGNEACQTDYERVSQDVYEAHKNDHQIKPDDLR